MPRKRIGETPLTNAERQRRYREKQKAQGIKRAWTSPGIVTHNEKGKEERRAAWEAEVQAEKLKAARAEGRRLARQKDTSRRNGYISGVCEAALFFATHDRRDLAQHLLAHFMIDREQAEAALQSDKRTKSMTLETLDGIKAWEPPPPLLK